MWVAFELEKLLTLDLPRLLNSVELCGQDVAVNLRDPGSVILKSAGLGEWERMATDKTSVLRSFPSL